MVFQVTPEKLLEYLDFFNGIKYLRNILVNISFNKSGYVFTDNEKAPTLIVCSPSPTAWICFLAGDLASPNIGDILAKIPEKKGILVPVEEEHDWFSVFKQQWKQVSHFSRTALSAKSLTFEHVNKLSTSFPAGYSIGKIQDQEMDYIAKNWEGWDFMENYHGYCIQEGKNIVSVAIGSLNPLKITQSLEIAIQTLPEYQGHGLATAVGAKLIAYCIKNGIEPHWDAANDISVHFAL
ncbi:MAG: GNAT family N-acetyltransferase [Candidatus Hodarchaeota archaeon]